ncbi:hypothetical protein [Kitasatospora sp. NPDC058046]|uniref:terpene synthase family protein n=1 Tax=Kitasatospora sp. NPDC058046 TaxID=3346312 RepID=UPI0036D8DF22
MTAPHRPDDRAATGSEPDDDRFPELLTRPPARTDTALAAHIDEKVAHQALAAGFDTHRARALASARFGHLAVMVFPNCDDVAQLTAAACWMSAIAAVDDVCDDEDAAGVPAHAGAYLTLALAALDPAHLTEPHESGLRRELGRRPYLRHLGASFTLLGRHATPGQLARIRAETTTVFTAQQAPISWRTAGIRPPVWEFLAARQADGFGPALALTDLMGGYELGPGHYEHPGVRRALRLANLAMVIVNDLYSQGKDAPGAVTLPALIAHERGYSRAEAISAACRAHNTAVREFDEACRTLRTALPDLMVARFLDGLRAWIAGARAWHAFSARYPLPRQASATGA